MSATMIGPLRHTPYCREGNRHGHAEFCDHLDRLHEFAISKLGKLEYPWLHEVVRIRLLVDDILPEGYDGVIAEAGRDCPVCDFDGVPLT